MANSKDLHHQMTGLFETFDAEHQKSANGNKAAGSRARKAIGELKKLVTDYRKASVEESK